MVSVVDFEMSKVYRYANVPFRSCSLAFTIFLNEFQVLRFSLSCDNNYNDLFIIASNGLVGDDDDDDS